MCQAKYALRRKFEEQAKKRFNSNTSVQAMALTIHPLRFLVSCTLPLSLLTGFAFARNRDGDGGVAWGERN